MIKRLIDKLVCLSRKQEKKDEPCSIELEIKNKSNKSISFKIYTVGMNKYELMILDTNPSQMFDNREILPKYNDKEERFEKTVTCKFRDMIDG